MKLIVGLGNPGKKYQKTRHNIGFMVLNALAGKAKYKDNKKTQSEFLELDGNILVKPQTFMNNSGVAVLAWAKKENIVSDNIIVIHDDKDLEFGKIKVQKDVSSAGHNGIKSLIEHLGTQNFWRIRIGVANAELANTPTDEFVLQNFLPSEKLQLPQIIEQAISELKRLI